MCVFVDFVCVCVCVCVAVCAHCSVNWIVNSSHNPPNKSGLELSSISPHDVYEQCVSWSRQLHPAKREARGVEGVVSESFFRSVWSATLKDMKVSIRQSKTGTAKCSFCHLIESQQRKCVNTDKKNQYKKMYSDHINFHRRESSDYETRIFRARDNPTSCWSIITDGADQSAHDMPRLKGNRPKNSGTWPIKLQGIMFHGALIKFSNIHPYVRTGANMMLTALMLAFKEASPKVFKDCPDTIYIQVDGGSENWNFTTMATIIFLMLWNAKLKQVIRVYIYIYIYT